MDGHRNLDGPSKRTGPTASFEREIESLLAVEPSPEFLARVRTRVAEEPAPVGWRLSWMFGAAAAVAAVVVALVAWPSPDVTPSVVMTRSSPPSVEPVPAVEPSPVIAPVPVTSRDPIRQRVAVNAVASVVESGRAIDIALPEVVLAENEVKAYAALVESVRQHRLDMPLPLAQDSDEPGDVTALRELAPVVIEPIEIEPLVKGETLE